MKRYIYKSKACKKSIYPSERVANKVIDNIRAESEERAKGLRVYYCSICKGYHLTKSEVTKTLKQGLAYYDQWQELLNRPD